MILWELIANSYPKWFANYYQGLILSDAINFLRINEEVTSRRRWALIKSANLWITLHYTIQICWNGLKTYWSCYFIHGSQFPHGLDDNDDDDDDNLQMIKFILYQIKCQNILLLCSMISDAPVSRTLFASAFKTSVSITKLFCNMIPWWKWFG